MKHATNLHPTAKKVARTLAGSGPIGKDRGRGSWFARHATLAVALISLVVLVPMTPGAFAQGLSAGDLALYRQAFKAADNDRHDEAWRLAQGARDPLPAKVLEWLALATPGSAGFNRIAGFVRENPDWPNAPALRRAAELAMGEASVDQILAWFKSYPPLTHEGFLRYADTLIAAGENERAAKLARDRWVETNLAPNEEQDIILRYRDLLRRSDHVARVDRLLWDRQDGQARRMTAYLDQGFDTLIDARLALAAETPSAEDAAARLPDQLRGDPGLLYDRVRFHRRRNDDAGAAQLLGYQPAQLTHAPQWWLERHILIRRLIERGDHTEAYRLAAAHGAVDLVSLLEAEFLAGHMALRFLDDADRAATHFEALYRAATTPITRARGAYWMGRAVEAQGKASRAAEWYAKAAPFGTTFYGQLAAQRLAAGASVRLPGEPRVEAGAAAAFERRELTRVARDLVQILGPDDDRVAPFLRRLSLEAKTPEDAALASRLARDLGRPDLAIAAAKDAAPRDVFLIETGYPVLDAQNASGVEPALVLSLIRQESTFNPKIVSSAGARGLMQLMPQTAKLVSAKLGVKDDKKINDKLISDPRYNMRLGSAYIGEMIQRYNGSLILAIGAYNAGPGRVAQWLAAFGDPRGGTVDPVDWIELIPINETRNYVQRVMEAMIVYQARLGGAHEALDLERELRR